MTAFPYRAYQLRYTHFVGVYERATASLSPAAKTTHPLYPVLRRRIRALSSKWNDALRYGCRSPKQP